MRGKMGHLTISNWLPSSAPTAMKSRFFMSIYACPCDIGEEAHGALVPDIVLEQVARSKYPTCAMIQLIMPVYLRCVRMI